MIVDRYIAATPAFKLRTIVHVGANVAQEAKQYEALNPARVVWVEGDPELFAVLCKMIERLNGGGIEHVGIQAIISDRDGEDIQLNRFNNNGGANSIFRATDTLYKAWPNVKETGKVFQSKSSRLDTKLAEAGIPPQC